MAGGPPFPRFFLCLSPYSWVPHPFAEVGCWFFSFGERVGYKVKSCPERCSAEMSRQDGNPECQALIQIKDRYGNTIKFTRVPAPSCALTRITSPTAATSTWLMMRRSASPRRPTFPDGLSATPTTWQAGSRTTARYAATGCAWGLFGGAFGWAVQVTAEAAFRLGAAAIVSVEAWASADAAAGQTANEIGVAGENIVSDTIGIPRNIGPGQATVPGTGPGGYRVPDFDPDLTVQSRGTVVEVKNVQDLQTRKRNWTQFAPQ